MQPNDTEFLSWAFLSQGPLVSTTMPSTTWLRVSVKSLNHLAESSSGWHLLGIECLWYGLKSCVARHPSLPPRSVGKSESRCRTAVRGRASQYLQVDQIGPPHWQNPSKPSPLRFHEFNIATIGPGWVHLDDLVVPTCVLRHVQGFSFELSS